MKNLLLLIFLGALVGCAQPRMNTRIALAGSGYDSVVVIDKASKEVVMKIALPERDAECNSVEVDKNGSILFSYRRGARLVSRHGLVVWDFVRDNENDEIQTAAIIDNGYLLGVCGNPSKIYEIDKDGNKTKVVKFDTGIENPHSQFRQIKKANNGNYLVPLMGRDELIEVNDKGEIVATLPIGGFSVIELSDGNLIVSAATKVVVVDRETGQILHNVPTPKSSFLTETNVVKGKKGLLLSNWQGHNGHYADKEWMVIEIDSTGKVVWEFTDDSDIKYVSAIHQYDAVVEEEE